MSEETTQLELGDELDRLSAMRGDGADDPAGPAFERAGVTVRVDAVAAGRAEGVAVAGPADARGRSWALPLERLHDEATATTVDGDPADPATLVDAAGGPAPAAGYLRDRAEGDVLAPADGGRSAWSVASAADRSPRTPGETVELAPVAVRSATVPGYRDRPRYRAFDGYGRPVDAGALTGGGADP